MEFGSILFHRFPQAFSDKEREALIEGLKVVLREFDVEFDEYQFADFPDKNYPISKCMRCDRLTLDVRSNHGSFESGDIFDSISRVIQLGENNNGVYLCNECKEDYAGS